MRLHRGLHQDQRGVSDLTADGPSRRSWLIGLAAASIARSEDAASDPRRLILDASRALQGGSAARFLSFFDKKRFDEFGALQRNVVALIETRTVASSVEVVSVAEEGALRRLQVDWLLQLTPLAGPGALETRQETVEIRLGPGRKDEWKISSLSPVDFFRAR